MTEAERVPCPVCGEMIVKNARLCRFCGESLATEPQPTAPETDSTGGLIPYKNGQALAAYYLGVFSVIPCFPIGLAAFLLGIKGLRNAKQTPQVRGKAHAWIGIVLGGLFGLLWTSLTVLGLIGAATQSR